MSGRSTQRQRSELAEQRDALLRSIEDLERERAAGDIDEDTFEDLHATYVARTAEVLRALDALPDEAGEPAAAAVVVGRSSGWRRVRRALGRRGTRRIFGIGATLCVLVTVGLVAALASGVRLPGQGVSGGVVIPQKAQVLQDLSQASAQASAHNLDQAIELYDAVLKDVPEQPEALTYKGWLERLVGQADRNVTFVKLGDESLAEAAKVAPGYPDAHGLYGIALLEDGGESTTPLALAQFRTFCADKGSAEILSAQGPTMAEAFVDTHTKVPSLLEKYVAGATK